MRHWISFSFSLKNASPSWFLFLHQQASQPASYTYFNILHGFSITSIIIIMGLKWLLLGVAKKITKIVIYWILTLPSNIHLFHNIYQCNSLGNGKKCRSSKATINIILTATSFLSFFFLLLLFYRCCYCYCLLAFQLQSF